MIETTRTFGLEGMEKTWYVVEDESGLCAMSLTNDYERLKEMLLEELDNASNLSNQ